MKKIVFGLLAIIAFSLVGNAQEKVGENQKGEYVITENLKNLKTQWDQLAKEEVTDYNIIYIDKQDSKGYYLIGQTKSGFKLATSLEYNEGVFYARGETELASSTCTCSGCGATGCDPRYLRGHAQWVCSDPCLNCKKISNKNYKKSINRIK